MLTAQDAIRLSKEISPEKKIDSLLGKQTQDALDNAVMTALSKCKNKVEVILKAKICKEPDEDIRSALKVMGYEDISVSSDFPAYNEDYEGYTTVKFKIPL